MGFILMIIGVPLAFLGLFLVGLFLKIRFMGERLELEVVGFQEAKNKGHVLPIVRYVPDEGEEQRVYIKVIDQISYLLSPAIEKQVISIVDVEGQKPRVYGYFSLVLGLICLMPMFLGLGLSKGNALLTGQASFILILITVMLGGWVAMKFIQRL